MLFSITAFFWNILWRLTMTGAVIGIGVLILMPLLRRLFPARWNLRLLTVPLLFFAIPFSLLLPKTDHFIQSVYISPMEFPMLNDGALTAMAAQSSAQAAAQLENAFTIYYGIIYGAAVLWLAVAALLVVWHLIKGIRFSRALQRTSHAVEEAEILKAYDEAAENLGLRKKPALLRCSSIGTPMLTGLVRPRLCLPELELSPEQLRLVLLHELTHYRQGDLWIKAAALVVGTVHWMNPVCYLLRKKLNLFGELACDEALSVGMNQEERKAYGMAVLELMGQVLSPGCTAFSKSGKQFKARLSALMEPKKISRPLRVSCGVFSILVLSAGLTVSSALGDSNAFNLSESASIGIIGGADGPTAIFTTDNPISSSDLNTPAAPSTPETAENSETAENPEAAEEAEIPEGFSLLAPIQNGREPDVGFQGYYGHTGTDYSAPVGTDVVAAMDGVIVLRKEDNFGYGKYLIIDHGNGISTLYAQNSELLVSEGDTVTAGQVIAAAGRSGNSTGPHCHFELRINGTPIDPLPYIQP